MIPADLNALRFPLIVLLAVLLVAVAAVYYSDRTTVLARQQLLRQQAQLSEARTRLQRSGEERDTIVRFMDPFGELERSGFVGEGQRINWADGLRLANQQAGLFGVEYQIDAQKPYAQAAGLSPGAITLDQSLMRLKFSLLHEEDLMRFLNALAGQDAGIFTVDQCALRRLEVGGSIRYRPNIAAECELSWITAKVAARLGPGKP